MTDHDDDTDDGMSAEEMMLGATEESPREELDMASEVGELLLSPSRIKGADQPADDPPFLGLEDDGGQEQAEGSFLVSAIFCLLGVGTLLPWNAFISSEPYFHARLCSLFGDGGGIELLFGLCFNVCGFLSLIVVIVTALKRADAQSSSGARERQQVMWALGLYLSFFLVTAGAVLVQNLDPTLFLVATLMSLSVFGSCLAVAGTNIVGIASLFPPQIAIAPFFAGQATGGAFISLTNFITATAESPNKFWDEHCRHSNSAASHFTVDDNECPSYQRDIPTFWYFLLGSVILVLCIIGFVVLDRLAITQYYRRLASGEQNAANDLTQPLLESAPHHPSATMNGDGDLRSDESSIQSVLKAIKFPALAILLTSFVTLSLFPAYTSTLQSVSMCKATNRLQNDLFEPLGFILFNFPDLLARIIAPMFIDIRSVQRRPGVLFLAAASRLIFPGLFLFAKSSSTELPYIHSDLYSISVSFAFAFSNGVLMSLCFMVAPLLLPHDSEETTRQRCSDFMNLNLACGLLGGSIASFILSKVATTL